jgi:hypothetical protein
LFLQTFRKKSVTQIHLLERLRTFRMRKRVKRKAADILTRLGAAALRVHDRSRVLEAALDQLDRQL